MSIFEDTRVPPILEPTENDIALMLAAKCHLGTKNVSSHMKTYVFSRRADGLQIIHLGKIWEKLILAARVLATLPPETIYVTFSSHKTRRPAIKLAQYLGCKTNQDIFVPGTFTNTLEEPSLLVCMDPMTDYQAVQESNKCNMPVIAFTNTHCSLKYIDLAIPCNNMGAQSLGLMCWLLSRAVLRLRGELNYQEHWVVLPDMFFYSDVVDEEEDSQGQQHPYGPMQKQENWGMADRGGFSFEIQGATDSWGENVVSQISMDQFEFSNVTVGDWAEDVPEEQEPKEEGWRDQVITASTSFAPSNTPWDD